MIKKPTDEQKIKKMNKHLQNYQTYQKHLARKERLIVYLERRPESHALDDLCDFLENESLRLIGFYQEVLPQDIKIKGEEIVVEFSEFGERNWKRVLPLWFLDDPERYYREKKEERVQEVKRRKEEAELWEKFKAEHGKK